MQFVLLATRNALKTREFAALTGSEFTVRDATSIPGLAMVEETGATFTENAILKATAISRIVPGLVVADDSGLEVDSLGGAPGVFSARYAGEHASDHENVAKLLATMRGADRAAQFRCVLALSENGETVATFDGVVRGRIADSAAGWNGFGYDPVFVPEGYEQTFAQLGDAVKSAISHRARAAAQLLDYLRENKKGGEDRRPQS
ncbi:MAG: RdgB/HAM1 family non-canonical purine NTP pyrophosphatase [Verrucomicrobiota bacterium]|nr:RdgB/HAM1 family non-canonical purine NTP pyrophosphatase [Verrucomicrobiota bacterium]